MGSNQPSTLIELLCLRALEKCDHPAYTFLTDGETESLRLTYGELYQQARTVGGKLQSLGASGERIVLLYPPGLEYIAAFFGCLCAGAIPVPAYPPRRNQSLARLQSIVADAQVKRVLTTVSIMSRSEVLFAEAPFLKHLQWLTTENLSSEFSDCWTDPMIKADALALLQYTSGSTSVPKGVMVTHQNLLHNERMIERAFQQSDQSVIVSWLPLYHDMGLIGGVLQPLYLGTHCILMSPVAFLQRPVRWLQAISRFRATTSGAPDFAYDMCVRKIPVEQRNLLDLSSWQVAFNGSEPIRAETLDRFTDAFEPCGFRRDAFYPCYGLAEGTLLVAARHSHGPAITSTVSARELKKKRVREVADGESGALTLVSCGGLSDQEIIIVDPETLNKCSAGEVGEIWVTGSSVAKGYWNNPLETERVFNARLAESGDGPFLRTGDLGFISGDELFITGRLKDLIIIRGLNYYPQDIEHTMERSHPALRPNFSAAFSVEVDGREELAVVQELDGRHKTDPSQIIEDIRKTLTVTHEIQPCAVVLIRQGTIAKTSSGKIQRHICRDAFLTGRLDVIAQWRAPLNSERETELAINPQTESDTESVEAWLVSQLGALLRIGPSEIHLDEPIGSYGIDSVSAIELIHKVETRFGISLPMTAFLKSPSINELAAQIFAAHKDSSASTSELDGAGIVSHGQRSLWFLHQLAPDSPAYNLAFSAHVRSKLEVEALRRAFQSLVNRHTSLRSTFTNERGEPTRHIQNDAEVNFQQLDGTGWTEQELMAHLAQEAQAPFDLSQGPLLRVILVERSTSEFTLLLVMHHIVGDYWSLALLLNELASLYDAERCGKAIPLASSRGDYSDYARWQNEMLKSPKGERLSTFWQSQLAGELPVLNLPTDRPRPAVQSYRGASETFKLNPQLAARLQSLSRANGATLYMTLLAAFQTFLYRYCGQEDFLVSSPTAGRSRADFAGVIGYFVNPIILRADLSGQPGFRELLYRVRETTLAAFEHQDYPFPLLVQQLQPNRDASRSPLIDVVFALQSVPSLPEKRLSSFALGEAGARVEVGGLELESIALEQQVTQFDLTLMMAELDHTIAGSLQYNVDLFEPATIKRMVANFQTLLEGIVADPDCSVAELPILSRQEWERLFPRSGVAGPRSIDQVFVHELVESQAKTRPDAIAITAGHDSLTYRELNERANRLARYLRKRGVGPEQVVGLRLGRNADLIIGSLAIIKAGAAYLTLDPSYPERRLRYMLENSGATVVITRQELAEELGQQSVAVCLDSEWEQISREDESDLGVKLSPENPAYAIYTSGSTGEPKGVMIEHRSLMGLVNWHTHTYGVTPEDRATQLAGLGFDAVVWETWPYLAAGASLHLVPEEVRIWPAKLQQWLAEENITISFLPTPLAEDLMSLDSAGNISVRMILTGGDRLRFYPSPSIQFKLINHYGPTEYTVVTTAALIEPVAGSVSPPTIGHPISNTQVYILDERLRPVPLGVSGEICISGEGLARGYINRPELTAERFIVNPFSETPGQRLYTTGDLGRYLPDGNLEFLGRRDYQVKVRGYRIELGEVEAALLDHKLVKEAVVLAIDEGAGGKRLIAYVVGQSPQAISPAQLRQHLKRRLPDYMLPSAYVELEQLPLTPNAKIDRKALSQIELSPSSPAEQECPATPVEEILGAIWCELLGLERVGTEQSFFELGGHSLLATQLISRVRERFNVEVPLSKVFQDPTIAALSGNIELELRSEVYDRLPMISAGSTEETLSFAQQRLWFLDRLDPANGYYNVAGGVRLSGPLNLEAVEKSFQEIVNRHEALRTNFLDVGGMPMLRVRRHSRLNVGVVDLSQVSETEQHQEAIRLARLERRRGFNLSEDELLRVMVLKMSEQEHVLLLTTHHIVTDGWSMRVLLKELGHLYGAYLRGEQPQLEPLKIQYRDYAAWQREWLQGGELERQLEYWKDQLGAGKFGLEIPGDRVRPPVMSHCGASKEIELSVKTSEQVRRMSRQEGVTVFMTLLAALNALLYRYTGEQDITIGTPISNRRQGETEGLIGLFANTLVLASEVKAEESFQQLLKRVRNISLGAYTHQDVPFEAIVEQLQPQRDLSRTPLFQVMFAYETSAPDKLNLEGVEASGFEVGAETAKFDLTIFLHEQDGKILGRIEYSTDLFEEQTVDRLVSHYENLLRSATSDPSLCIGELPLMDQQELELVLTEWNRTEGEYARGVGLHELFESQVAQTPNNIALGIDNERLSYRELNERANQLAHYLRLHGIGPEKLVAICMSRSAGMVVGMLAVLKAGGAYLPIDPAYPEHRQQFMLDDSRATVVLTQRGRYRDLGEHAKPVYMDSCWSDVEHEPRCNLDVKIAGSNLAYVIYTSGSTGTPKGVGIQHSSAVALLSWARDIFSPEELSGVLASTSICFDLSIYELFLPLTCGGKVILAENALHLRDLAAAGEVTLVNTVPSAMAELCAMQCLPPSVMTINLAGEPLRSALVHEIYKHESIKKVYNLYGPSEDTTYSTYCLVTRDAGEVTIGRPISNKQVYILDQKLRPVPLGVSGEIYLSGEGLARGYINRPDSTAEKFIPNPFTGKSGDRLYRTGDIGRYLASGNIQFLGRIDHQVKLRGFRIELGEIESVLKQHQEVHNAVVVVREDEGDRRVVAYVVPREDGATAGIQLRSYLKARLPEYMVPGAIVLMEALPLTPNGKVDRKALPAPQFGSDTATAVTPATPVEEVLVSIWCQVLDVSEVGVNENFFELGGHSLLVTQVMSRVREAFAVEVGVREMFERPTIRRLGELIERERRASGAAQVESIRVAERGEALALSSAQQRLWFLDQLEPNSPFYNLAAAVRLTGQLDIKALEQSINEVIRRHESLRTRFITIDGEPLQVIEPELSLRLKEEDLSSWPEQQQELELSSRMAEQVQRGFDLSVAPLMRIRVMRKSSLEHVLVVVMHHIISDGWSIAVLNREIAVLYEAYSSGASPELKQLPIQYADYAVWERERIRSGDYDEHLRYWEGLLSGSVAALEIPADRPRPAVQSHRGALERFRLGQELSEKIKRVSRRESATVYIVLLAAMRALLYRYTGQEYLNIGTPLANRNRVELESLIGVFVNTVVMRLKVEARDTFRDLVRRVREEALRSYSHGDVPFEAVVEKLHPERDLSRSPLFQVMFSIENMELESIKLSGLEAEVEEVDSGTAKFDLLVMIREEDEGISCGIEYNSDIFDAERIRRMGNHYTTLLEAAVEGVERKVTELELMRNEELDQVKTWNETTKNYGEPCSLHELFEQQATKSAGAIAVEDEHKAITYDELNRRANQLGRYLRKKGVGREGLVGIYMERDVDLVVALLGALKSGGAYVPLDPSYPAERLAFMVEDAHIQTVLTQGHLIETLPRSNAGIICIDSDWELIAQEGDENLNVEVTPDNLAYMIYTSGSTGLPKGVMNSHRGIFNRLAWMQDAFQITEADRVLQKTPFSFDVSVWEFFWPLLNGGSLVMARPGGHQDGDYLVDQIIEKKISIVHFVPSMLQVILSDPGLRRCESLRLVVCSGEGLPRELQDRFFTQLSCSLENLYGPTEAAVDVTRWKCEPDYTGGGVPIGRPIANTRIHLLDNYMQPVPIGIPGELHIGGVAVARGYLNRPDLTAEKFIPDRFSEEAGARLYRTGDLARYLPDGNIEFLGRIDDQVKLRGFRIELGEIEAVLGQHPAVRECVVLVREEASDKRLVGYVVGGEVSGQELREYLRQRVPEYMVPGAIVLMEALPLTPNGKVDRKALPAPNQARPDTKRPFVAPTNPTQEILAGIWSNLLGIEQVGIDDNFFELGGHSLLATRMLSRARETFNVELPLRTIFESATIAGISEAIEKGRQDGLRSSVPAITAFSRAPFRTNPALRRSGNRSMAFKQKQPVQETTP